MNKPKHTPGPWFQDGTYVRDVNTGSVVAEIDLAVHTGNARLIAAAPELLAVLQDYIDDQNGVKLLNGMDIWKRMNVAVIKATGGAE
jgi:hypothetical protein